MHGSDAGEVFRSVGKILSIEPAAELIGKAPLYLTVAVQDDSHRLPGVKRALGFTFTDTETGAVYEAGGSIYTFDGYYSDLLEQKTFCISATNEKVLCCLAVHIKSG